MNKIYSLDEIKALEVKHKNIKGWIGCTPYNHIDIFFYTQDCIKIKKELQMAYKSRERLAR